MEVAGSAATLETILDMEALWKRENRSFWRRERDDAVLNFLYGSMPDPKLQTVRGVLTEGAPLCEGAYIQSKTHVQWAVRDPSCIKGAFRMVSGGSPPHGAPSTSGLAREA